MRVSWLADDVRRSITRNRGSFMMTAAVQAVCLTLLGLFAVGTFGIARLNVIARRQLEVYAFLEPGADPVAVESRIARMTGIAATRYVSSEEALAELQAELGADSAVLAAIETNPLPASIRVALEAGSTGPTELEDIERRLALLPGVAEVFSGAETIARLGRLLRILIVATSVVILIASLAVVFIAFGTVESSLRSRGREIEIMQLVGASRAAIRLPFVVEGGIQGMLSGIAAALILLALMGIARALLIYFPLPVLPLMAAGIGIGLALGISGSLFALAQLNR